ncbi:class I adenylate-forming enzyme family protein [Streptomyces buecherae]|uniref:AMP-binding protein n=1 Tax=Streptomyces buecherae TaxID=2763006 RepID=A0A7H8NCN6_9ACTN|nr:AMP-binding protein [Streptomyces buecherae]QKW52126.1 AMP-binding protein [Streptomyces buecherae]
MWMAHFVKRNRLLRPDNLALADPNRRLTWREFDERTDALATALLDRGVEKGQRVAVSARSRVEVLELYVAGGKAGVVVCPINPSFPAPEVEHIVRNVEPVGVFSEQQIFDRLGDAFGDGWRISIGSEAYEEMATSKARELPLPRQDDIFAILHTSATTGHAKGVAVTHRSVSACYTAMAAEVGFSADDVMVNPCPLFHGSVVIGLALFAAGGALVLEPEFTPQRWLADVAEFKATKTFLVPSMARFVLRTKAFAGADLSSLKDIMFGGAPMPQELLRECLEKFPAPMRSIYGITEGGGPIATHLFRRGEWPFDAEGTVLPTAGRMLPGYHIEVQDDSGNVVPTGDVGEICVRGDGMMLLYWRNTEATAKTVRDGWLRTGDVGYADEDGFLYLVDRRNDVLIRGGQNVYPAEIERVLATQPGVLDVAVVGAPNDEWGEVPVAFVAAGDEPPTVAALIGACARELASYKRPTAVHFVDEIPRNGAGKLLRRVLRDRLAAEAKEAEAKAAEAAKAEAARAAEPAAAERDDKATAGTGGGTTGSGA